MNELQTTQETISTLTIAEMMETTHKSILRKLEGRTVKGKRVDGVIDIITRNQMAPSDYFIESSYIDASGKENKCYECTRKGCELLAHKFQGEKGILFTIRYIERFHQMEQFIIEQEQPQQQPKSYPLLVNLWKAENESNFKYICSAYKIERSKLYHKILVDIGEIYDIEAYKVLYRRENGFSPQYIMDVVAHFPELREEADTIIKIHMNRISLTPNRFFNRA